MNNGAFLAGMCVGFIVFFLIALSIGALILMGAVWIANKCLPQPASRHYIDDYDDYEDDWEYERPRRRQRSGSPAIPPPNFGWAMLIVFVNAVAGVIVSVPINLALGVGMAGMGNKDPMMGLLSSLIQLPIGFFILAGLATAMLPTSFLRACLVVLFYYLIIFAISLLICLPIVLLVGIAGAR